MFRFFLVAAAILSLGVNTTMADEPLKAFPEADEGMVRHVLKLPQANDESLLKVELIVGKTSMLDEVNRYFHGGKIVAETVEGWGYTRYVVKELGPLAGTLIAVPPDAPKVERFVTLGGEPFLIRYNSRMPVVVYVPEGAEVRYRIWRTDPAMSKMPQG